MNDPDTLVTERAFARTYDGGDYDNTWSAVKQYRRAVTFSVDNPETSIGDIASAADAPTERIRPWIDEGAVPPVIQGLYSSHSHDWIGVTYDNLTPLNVLVANVYSGGTIHTNHTPKFTLNDDGHDATVIKALELAGTGYRTEESGTSQAVVPGEDAIALGRVLTVLGAPMGRKTEIEGLSLPWYLDDSPESVRKRFVDSYLENRALTDPTTDSIQIMEDRSQSYREELAELIESVTGERVTVGDESVTLSAEASRALGYERA
ncbi:hypothetical protein [Natrinema ejinorense]|uniref:Uncharacterized protein n=1 Tax=Natrinema ejinorense TaxID=373386 RepID=A0A2A5QRE2_9EURY|nr:hypothetical protein [Natrinema ejinorense]PCR89418.1 hypothetical protein CP557_02020 [Natrinema ejinorense]